MKRHQLLAVAVTFCSLLPINSILAEPLTPEKLQQIERPTGVSISPDSHYLAVTMTHGDLNKNKNVSELRFYAFPPTKGLSKPIQTLTGVSNLRWCPAKSGPTRCLLIKSEKEQSQAFLFNPAEGSLKQITHQEGGISQPVWSPDGLAVAYTSRVKRSSPISPVPTEGNTGRLYDDLFLRRWTQYYDGKFEHLFLQKLDSQAATDLTPFDRDFAPTSSTYSGADNCCFSGDGSRLFYSAPPARGHAFDTNYDVYELDLKTRQIRNLTGANPAADFGPRLSADGTRVYFWSHKRVGYESDRPQIRSIDSNHPGEIRTEEGLNRPLGVSEWLSTADGGAVYSFLDKEQYYLAVTKDNQSRQIDLKGLGPHSLSIDSGGRILACTTTSLAHPPTVTIVDLNSGLSRDFQVSTSTSKLELSDQIENVSIQVNGGQMGFWIIKPRHFDPSKKWPVAMLIHGGPQGAWTNDWSLRWNAQVWAARGYVVVMPNPRGSSSRSLQFQDEVSRDWGGRPYQDLMQCLDYLHSLPYIDKDRTLAAGASFGGYMVNWIAVHSQRFRALVTHCGVWNLDSMYGTTDETWFSDWEFGGVPWGPNRPVDYDKFSPHRYAEKLAQYKTPHLVVHNDLDFRCPVNQGLELFTALQRQGVPSRFLGFPDEGHWVTKPNNSVRWYREVFQFVEQHCPPGPK